MLIGSQLRDFVCNVRHDVIGRCVFTVDQESSSTAYFRRRVLCQPLVMRQDTIIRIHQSRWCELPVETELSDTCVPVCMVSTPSDSDISMPLGDSVTVGHDTRRVCQNVVVAITPGTLRT